MTPTPLPPLADPITRMDRLVAIQRREIAKARTEGLEFFFDLPDCWYEPRPTYGCENGHISHAYLKSETSGKLCLECHRPIVMLPGHYTDESLSAALKGNSHD